MACPSCNHTMAGLGSGIFHCGRCGTIKMPCGSFIVPYLVERCRKFEEGMAARAFATAAQPNSSFVRDGTPDFGFTINMQEWNATGIRESINLPEARPPI